MTASHKPLPLFYAGDKVRVVDPRAFGWRDYPKAEVVKVGRKFLIVRMAKDGAERRIVEADVFDTYTPTQASSR